MTFLRCQAEGSLLAAQYMTAGRGLVAELGAAADRV